MNLRMGVCLTFLSFFIINCSQDPSNNNEVNPANRQLVSELEQDLIFEDSILGSSSSASLKKIADVVNPTSTGANSVWTLISDFSRSEVQIVKWDGSVRSERLTANELTALKSASMKPLCRPIAPPPGQTCALIYKYPYATYFYENFSVKIGEVRGCSGSPDFCALSDRQAFKTALLAIRLNHL